MAIGLCDGSGPNPERWRRRASRRRARRPVSRALGTGLKALGKARAGPCSPAPRRRRRLPQHACTPPPPHHHVARTHGDSSRGCTWLSYLALSLAVPKIYQDLPCSLCMKSASIHNFLCQIL